MDKSRFTLLKGGYYESQAERLQFVSAYVTDTRLMGVMCMHIHWISNEADANEAYSDDTGIGPDFHQFFYIDAEEFGLENYKGVRGNDYAMISVIEQTLSGGLGGKPVEINEAEAAAILQEYAGFNRDHGLPLPEGYEEFEFLLQKKIDLTHEQLRALAEKQCCPIMSDYHAINYFLMRIFGQDYKAAEYLMGAPFDNSIYDRYTGATLFHNTIDGPGDYGDQPDAPFTPAFADDAPQPQHTRRTPIRKTSTLPSSDAPDSNAGEVKYRCTSLIESMDSYHIVLTELTMRSRLITGMENISEMKISSAEAAMMLARSEFITVYGLLTDADTFNGNMLEASINAVINTYDNGTMYMIFNKHNDHVNRRVFDIHNDVFGLYYVTEFGQLLVSSSSRENIQVMERDVQHSSLAMNLLMTAKFEFREPILYDFVNSEFDYFEEFLSYIGATDQ